MEKTKNFIISFWKYYLLKKPKLILNILLTIIIYSWIANIYNELMTTFDEIYMFAYGNSGIYVPFIKPIFMYISGLIIIKKI